MNDDAFANYLTTNKQIVLSIKQSKFKTLKILNGLNLILKNKFLSVSLRNKSIALVY